MGRFDGGLETAPTGDFRVSGSGRAESSRQDGIGATLMEWPGRWDGGQHGWPARLAPLLIAMAARLASVADRHPAGECWQGRELDL
jgi:hypothetical protein